MTRLLVRKFLFVILSGVLIISLLPVATPQETVQAKSNWPVAVTKVIDTDLKFNGMEASAATNPEVIANVQIKGNSLPEALAVNQVTNRIYVAGMEGVSVLDGAANSVVALVNTDYGGAGVAVNPDTMRYYVTNPYANSVSVFDETTDVSIAIINVGSNPGAIALNPSTNRIYVANEGNPFLNGNGTVSVIDGESNTVEATITVGCGPSVIAINQNNNHIYVAGGNPYGTNGYLSVIDGATATVVKTIDLSYCPEGMAVNSVADRLYVTINNSILVFDTMTESMLETIDNIYCAAGITLNPITNIIYVNNAFASSFTVIDGATNVVLGSVYADNCSAIAVNAITNIIYVANGTNGGYSISVFDGVENVEIATVALLSYPSAVAVNPVTNLIYIANDESNNISVIDGNTNIIVDTLALKATDLTVDPNTNRLYVANQDIDRVSIIDGSTTSVIKTIDVDKGPRRIAVNPKNNHVYVAYSNNSMVSVVDGLSGSLLASIDVGSTPTGIAVNSAIDRVYVIDAFYGDLWVIDDSTVEIVAKIQGVGNRGIAVNSETNQIYVGETHSDGVSNINTVSVIDGITDSISATINIGGSNGFIEDLAVNSATNNIYVVWWTGGISVIEGNTNIPIAGLELIIGEWPNRIAANAITSRIYVSNWLSHSVSVIQDMDVGPLPRITSMVPNTGKQGQTLTNVIFYGYCLTGATALIFSGTGVTANNLSVNTEGTQITADVTIASDATEGPRDVFVTTPAGISGVLSDGFSIIAPSTIMLGNFRYSSVASSTTDYEETYYYSDSYFDNDSETYNSSLATMSLCLAMSAYSSNEEEYPDKDVNVKNLLLEIGFGGFESEGYYSPPWPNSIGVALANKQLTVDAKTYTLIIVAIRGTVGKEWAGDFTLGATGDHEDFDLAKTAVITQINDYIDEKAISGDVKLWITGHSRGAATANLVAAAFDNKTAILTNCTLNHSDIYAYTFESPQATIANDANSSTYSNIFNIVNTNDIVTWVAPYVPKDSNGFTFKRYGIDKILLAKTDNNYSEAYSMMREHYYLASTSEMPYLVDDFMMRYYNLIQGEVWRDWDKSQIPQNEFIRDFITDFSLGELKSRANYVDKYQYNIRDALILFYGLTDADQSKLTKIVFDKFNNNSGTLIRAWLTLRLSDQIKIYLEDSLKEAGVSNYDEYQVESLAKMLAQILPNLILYYRDQCVTLFANLNGIANAHCPEVCLAWLEAGDPNYETQPVQIFSKSNGSYRIIRINCPVDVEVYDRSNSLLASIISDVPQDITNSNIISAINEDGEKLIYLPADMDYIVNIIPTGSGQMTYSVNEYNPTAGNINRIVNYYDKPIQPGEVLIGEVPAYDNSDLINGAPNGSATVYSLQDSNNNLIAPDVDLKGTDATNAYYMVSVISNNIEYGYVSGQGFRQLGNYAQVTATPFEGFIFEGWYINNTKISSEQEYRFCVQSDVELVAKFITVNYNASVSGGILTFNAPIDMANNVSISLNTGNIILTDTNTGYTMNFDSNFTQVNPNQITCSNAGISQVIINLGDGNDSLNLEVDLAANIDGGTGTDTLTVKGTGGNDVIKMAAADVVINGIIDNYSNIEDLQLDAENGDDVITAAGSVGAIINGGDGSDTLTVTGTSSSNCIAVTSTTVTVDGDTTDYSNIENLTNDHLTISMTASPNPVTVGNELTYSITIINTGSSGYDETLVTDSLPGNLTYVSASSSQGSCSITGSTVTCNLGTLASDTSATITIVATSKVAGTVTNHAAVTAGIVGSNTVINTSVNVTTAKASSGGGGGGGGGGGTAPSTDLSITGSDSPDPVDAGSALTYTLTVKNNGPKYAGNVQVIDTLPDGVSLVSTTANGWTLGQSGDKLTFSLADNLGAGASSSITIKVTAPEVGGNLTNIASVSGDVTDPDAANNSVSISTTVSGPQSENVTPTPTVTTTPTYSAAPTAITTPAPTTQPTATASPLVTPSPSKTVVPSGVVSEITSTPVPSSSSTPTGAVSWGLIIGLIIGVVVIGLIILLLAILKRRI